MNSHKLLERVKQSELFKRMAYGVFWTFAGTCFAKFIVLVGGIICAHLLNKSEYGELGMVRSTINMFVVFGTAGLGVTATKYISEYKENNKEHIVSIYLITNGFAVIMGLVVTALVLIYSKDLAIHTLKAPQLETPIKVGAFLLFVTILNAVQNGTLAGFEDFKSIAINTLIGSIVETTCMLLGAYYWGVIGGLIGYGAGFITLFIVNYISIRRQFVKANCQILLDYVEKKDFSLLYKFSIPAAFSAILVAPVFWVGRSMLVRENGFSELAIYEVADQWKVIILFIPTAVCQIVLPILSSLGQTETNRFKKVLLLNIILNAVISLLIAFIVCLCSGFIMRTYGSEYTDVNTLNILALSTVFTSISNVVGLAISSKAKMWYGFAFNLCWATSFIIITKYLLIKGYGASGVAWGVLLSYLLLTIIQSAYLYLTVLHKHD